VDNFTDLNIYVYIIAAKNIIVNF